MPSICERNDLIRAQGREDGIARIVPLGENLPSDATVRRAVVAQRQKPTLAGVAGIVAVAVRDEVELP